MSEAEKEGPLDPRRALTIVSGLPRSGTSLMMQMLEAAGLAVAVDGNRDAYADNPRGYYELDAVKRLPKDASFVKSLVGQAVKVVAPLLRFLPPELEYRVIFMERDLQEVLASQRAMLDRLEEDSARQPNDEALGRAYTRQLREVKRWLAEHENIRVCFVSHRLALDSPEEVVYRVAGFLEETGAFRATTGGNQTRARAARRMAGVVDPSLHRRRSTPTV